MIVVYFVHFDYLTSTENRVYRLGQKKDVYIKRFLMRDTVEENIHTLNRQRSLYSIESYTQSTRERMRANELRVRFEDFV